MNEKLDKFHAHEALDRCHIINCNIEDHLQSHPFVKQHEEVRIFVDAAISNLAKAYSLIGNLSDN